MNIRYLSPSALSLFQEDPTGYIKRYILKEPFEQSAPMALGSSFDAFVKNALIKDIYGSIPDEYEINALFEKQVSPDHQSWAWAEGKELFDMYVDQGAYSDLLDDMEGCKPVFEVRLEAEVAGVPLVGYPDCYYYRDGKLHILDWKCNGAASPFKYYVKQRPKNVPYKEETDCFSNINKKWAMQMTVYGLMLGEEDFELQIEQVLTKNGRCITYKAPVSDEFKQQLLEDIVDSWDRVQRGMYFKELSEQENRATVERMKKASEMENVHPLLRRF